MKEEDLIEEMRAVFRNAWNLSGVLKKKI